MSSAKAVSIHEEFLVATEKNERQLKVVRQDRYEVKDVDCMLALGNETFEVLNYSTFGLAIYSKQSFAPRPESLRANLIVEGIAIAEMTLKKVREEGKEGEGFKIAFEIQNDPLNLTRIRAVTTANEIITEQALSFSDIDHVPQDIRNEVYETKDQLESLETAVNSLEEETERLSHFEAHQYELGVIEVISEHIRVLLQNSLDTVEKYTTELSPEQMKGCYEFYRKKLNHLLYQSPFSRRSIQKPLGYAGDYEMMNIMYRNENIGTTLFAKSLHRCYMNCSNAQAVRNRISFLTNRILSTVKDRGNSMSPLKVLSVASGPAEEMTRAIEGGVIQPKDLEIHLIDQDLSALREAQRSIRTAQRKVGKEFHAKFFHKAIKNLIAEGLQDKYDFIYSAGLFDYFTDPVAQMAAKRLFDMLNPGGTLVIGNFTAAPGIKIRMDLILDWSLIYRTNEDLQRLYAPFGPSLKIESEPEQINLFVILKK